MKNEKNKTIAISIVALFILSMTASVTLISNVNGATSNPTFTFINVSPNPIGVGQTVNVNFWVDMPVVFSNITVTVTKPNGNSATLGPFTSDLTGGAHTTYTTDTVGNYTFQTIFGGQTIGGIYWQPSISSVFTLTVQQEQISYPPITPLPTTYWTRPIYAENSIWNSIAGNWLSLAGNELTSPGLYNSSGNYAPYTTAPNSAHILWTKPATFGGVIGGEYGSSETSDYASTAPDEAHFSPIIINGVLYHTIVPGAATNPEGWEATDLNSGQTLWTKNTTDYLLCGQVLNYVNVQEFGGIAYLWAQPLSPTPGMFQSSSVTNDLDMYDAFTGNYILTITGGPGGYSGGTMTIDDHGDLCFYYVNSTDNTLNLWNSTLCIFKQESPLLQAFNFWRPPQGAVLDFAPGIQWSAPLATSISGTSFMNIPNGFGGAPGLAISGINGGVIFMTIYQSVAGITQSGWRVEAGYSQADGQQLWIVNRTETPDSIVIGGSSTLQQFTMSNGIYVEITSSTFSMSGYSVGTGKQLWGPVILPNARQLDSLAIAAQAANGTIYIYGYGGDVWAYNMQTGAFIWHYQTPNGGLESPYGVEPLWTYPTATVADGKIFLAEGHEYSPPLFHGAQQLALNTTNGSIVWSISGFDVQTPAAISDGIMTTLNSYDNQIYAYGMGPTKTTVNAPDIGVTTATPITITGTVMDISAGSQQEAVAANFPNGLPCVSDASMTQFMEAVYEQQPMPTNITGVPVTLTETDHNGNTYTIGTTTTSSAGTFGFDWAPPIPGNYTVVATFAGSNAYYGSCAETYIYASSPAPTAAPTASPPTGLASTASLMLGVAVLAIIIIIIGVVLAILMLRKHP
jgi:hypothetical protein